MCIENSKPLIANNQLYVKFCLLLASFKVNRKRSVDKLNAVQQPIIFSKE